MSLPGNGIFVVQGEMGILVTAMRRGSRWGSHSSQDEEHDVLMRAFQDLREILNQVADLRLLDPNVFLSPFLEVIRSEKTTGPVTCLALSAINKFLCYGLIDPMHVSVPATVENIADAVTHARFVGTDHSSDGVVLMKILQVLRTLVLSPEGAMLTDESVCEIMLSCFRICFETRLSELLRRNAEQCLRDMTQLVFMRLPQFSGSSAEGDAALAGGSTLSLRRRASSKRDRNAAKQKEDTSRLQVTDNSSKTSGVLSPMVKTSISGSHLSTTPVMVVGDSKVLDMQGSISRTPNPSVDGGHLPSNRSISDVEKTPEQQKISNPNEADIEISIQSPSPQTQVKSPSKKHGRHSSMDLAANDIFISQLVEKCVNSAETSTPPKTQQTNEKTTDEGCVIESDNETGALGEEIIAPDGRGEETEEKDGVGEEKSELVEISENQEEKDGDKDYVNPQGVRFVSQEDSANLQPYGIVCVRELFKFLISLCNPTQNTSTMVHLGLCLVETALEVGADHLAKYPSFLQLVKDPLCRNLLGLLNSERVSIFALDLQVSFLLFESLRTHLKLQMESYFTKLVEIIISDSAKNTYELKEITHLALESIGQFWRIPGFCTELYLNYDCDVYCTNLFEDITKLLSKTIVTAGVYNYHVLSLDALTTLIESIEGNCHQIKAKSASESDVTLTEDAGVNAERSGHVAIDMHESWEPSDEAVIHDISQYISCTKMGRHKPTPNLPTPEQLQDTKNRKRWIATGSEHFNQKPEKGIEFLQEHGILSSPLDPLEIAHFLRNNPGLDKKMIGEYISKKKNVESRILATYAASFDMAGLRVDQALRLYLETFRLPGEAPLIFLVMEHFAEHWHACNGNPFANTDAAFRLAYAIIMLNMDQHNHNAKKLNVPMNAEDFVRNLRGCNGSEDFDQKMLEAVFNSIKNEEIVMPAERTGTVKEDYLWKVLLRRGATSEGQYVHAPSGAYHKQLFLLAWGPTIAALSSIFEKSSEAALYSRALDSLDKCASIVGQHCLHAELDTLLLGLCKFTGLLSLSEQANHISIGVSLGQAPKCQLALKKVFSVVHRHPNCLREGWKHILEVLSALFKGRLLPKCLTEADDFCSPTGKVSLLYSPSLQPKVAEPGLLSSLYSYIALSSESSSVLRQPSPEEAELMQVAAECVSSCSIPTILITDSKFLEMASLQELIKYLIVAGKVHEAQKPLGAAVREDPTIFFLELLIKVVIQNRDRVSSIWHATESHVCGLMKWSASCSPPSPSLQRSCTALLRLAICLMRSEECASDVLRSLKALLELPYPVYHSIATRIAIGLFELVKTSAQNIHSGSDWAIVFTLLETTGAGARHLKQDENMSVKSDGAVSSEDDSVSTDRGYTSDSELSHSPPTQGWILVGKDAEAVGGLSQENPLVHACALRPHDPQALLKCWECLAFIVRDVAHITPYNFEACINCIRTFVEASLHGTNEDKVTTPSHLPGKDMKKRRQASHVRRTQRQQVTERAQEGSADNDSEAVPDGYQLISIQLLDLMHTLHIRTAQIFKWWREETNFTNNKDSTTTASDWCDLWHLAWQPLLQGIARLCTDNRKQVSNNAVTYLQRALLVHDLQILSGEEWEACFHRVLFPLLARLHRHHDELRLRANTIMCKVFLHHLTPLVSRPSFPALWLSLLELMRCMMTGPHTTDLLYEGSLESLKNMLLVMDSVKVFDSGDGYSELWNMTWERINTFIPHLKEELFKPIENTKVQNTATVLQQQEISQTVPADVQAQSPGSLFLPSGNQFPYILTPPLSTAEPQANLNQQGGHGPSASPGINVQNQQAVPASTARTGSIILQPPTPYSQVHSPIFSHLGQMVSTPIGVAVPVAANYPILCPNPIPQKYYNTQLQAGATPASMSNQNIATSNQSSQSQMSKQNNSPSLMSNQYNNQPLMPNQNSNQLLTSNQISSQSLMTSNQNIHLTNSQFTIIPQQEAYHDNSNQSNELTKLLEDNVVMPQAVNPDIQQPGSLYGEYITNPYNPVADIPLPKISCETPTHTQLNNANIERDTNSFDRNLNFPSPLAPQKSQSVTSSPMHSQSQITSTFGSSDNIKTIARTTEGNTDASGLFTFSKYFYSDSTNIPPGSEILFGDNFLSNDQ